jgi:diguanylate cyclase (GGDEF)-like protein
MSRSLSEIEKKFIELEQRFSEIENLNNILARQAKEYYLLYDSIRKLSSCTTLKTLYKALDKILNKNFQIDEYAFIRKNKKAEMLSVQHSMGLSKRPLREIFYKPKEGLVGKVYIEKRAVYIPDTTIVKTYSYYFEKKSLTGSLYYLPILDQQQNCLGVLKLRKIIKEGFSDIERTVLPNLQIEIGAALLNVEKLELLNSKSYMDELTHLYNRRYYNEHFPIEFKRAQRYQHELSLMFIDIDDFKEINDTYGHFVGDIVLQKISDSIKNLTRSSDICIRYGGDEFLIVLPETSRQAASEVAAKLRSNVAAIDINLNGNTDLVELRLSMGISSYPQDTIEPNVLVELADKALYRAKSSGKDQIVLADNIG